jgi:hypothetical protein
VGVTLGLSLALACRDAPTAPPSLGPGFSADLIVDSTDQVPPEPRIINPYTQISFTDFQEHHILEIRTGMEYLGNRASMKTGYAVAGEGANQSGEIYNEENSTYNPRLWKSFDRVYPIEVARSCGLTFDANTIHQAWWAVYVRIVPEWLSHKAVAVSRADTYQLMPCEKEQQEETTTSSGGGGSYITITTCWYWAIISGGRVIAIEFDYCESTVVPIDPEYIVNQM